MLAKLGDMGGKLRIVDGYRPEKCQSNLRLLACTASSSQQISMHAKVKDDPSPNRRRMTGILENG